MAAKFVEDIDRGYRAIRRRWDRLTGGGVEVTVGPRGPRFPSPDDGENPIDDNTTLAFIHEFGRGNVPERPFMRATFDLNRPRYLRIVAKAGGDYVVDDVSAKRAFGRAAEAYRSDVVSTLNGGAKRDSKGRFLQGSGLGGGALAPLAPLTERRLKFKRSKGWSLLPLNATQQLIQSIRASEVKFRP